MVLIIPNSYQKEEDVKDELFDERRVGMDIHHYFV